MSARRTKEEHLLAAEARVARARAEVAAQKDDRIKMLLRAHDIAVDVEPQLEGEAGAGAQRAVTALRMALESMGAPLP